jgi:hypothetical protein
MARPPRPDLSDIVPHPRYGDAVVPSGHGMTEEQVRSSFWRYREATLFPVSAIPADIRRQNFSTMARGCYVDILKTCVDCERAFLFFAREQQHWYEVLGFYVDADCVRCPACRKSEQQLRRRFRRYSEASARKEVSDEALATLVEDAVFLWTAGILRDEQRLRRLRNLALRRIPSSRAAKNVERVVAKLAPRKTPPRT